MTRINFKTLLSGIMGGMLGGAIIDFIFITFVGPSGFFILLGITGRSEIFLGHIILGGILGIILGFIAEKFVAFNIYWAGIIFGLICLGLIGGIPSLIVGIITIKTTFFGLAVWLLYGLILAKTTKSFNSKIPGNSKNCRGSNFKRFSAFLF